MNLSKPRVKKKNVDLMSRFSHRLNVFSYLLISSNKVSDKVYSFLLIFDLTFFLIMPLEILANLGPNKQFINHVALNYIHAIGNQSYFLVLTDTINLILLSLLIMTTIIFLAFDPNITNKKQ
jgi:hypothetical protein